MGPVYLKKYEQGDNKVKIKQTTRIYTIIEIGKQSAVCKDNKGEELELARYKLPLEANVGTKLYQDNFSMFKLLKENDTYKTPEQA